MKRNEQDGKIPPKKKCLEGANYAGPSDFFFFLPLSSVTFSFLSETPSSSWLSCCLCCWPLRILIQKILQISVFQSSPWNSFHFLKIDIGTIFNFSYYTRWVFLRCRMTVCHSLITGFWHTHIPLLLGYIKGSAVRLRANMFLEFLLGKAFISVICSTSAL